VASIACNYCFAVSQTGASVCDQDHFVCSTCIRMRRLFVGEDSSQLPCSPETCGFVSQAELCKFPPYWTQYDRAGFHLVLDDPVSPSFWQLLTESVIPACREGVSECTYGNAKAWGSISKVLRIENGTLWTNYSNKKLELLDRVKQDGGKIAKLPDRGKEWRSLLFADVELSTAVNEFFLFHGTKLEVATTIAQEGFKLEYAKPNGLYGGGIYFADAACKSMQYCSGGTKVFLISRVLMGSACRIKTHNSGKTVAPEGCDSVFAETGKARNGKQFHNEYVVYDASQIYPEYLVYIAPPS
jgi:hypothetical protein